MPDPAAPVAPATVPVPPAPQDSETVPEQRVPAEVPALVEEDLLVEDVSIDGMCGVY